MMVMRRGREVKVNPKVVWGHADPAGCFAGEATITLACGCILKGSNWVVDSGSIQYPPMFCLEHGAVHYGMEFKIPEVNHAT